MKTKQNGAVSLRNPTTWTPSVLQLLDATACALMAVCQLVRTRAAASGSPVLRANADRDASAWQAAMEKRGADLLRGRIERMRPNKRPHYSPQARFEIVQYMRLRHWSGKQTAAYFAVHPNRIRAWVKEMRRNGEASRLFKPPVNRISDAVRWLVHQLRELCPEREFGTRSIAMPIVRAGKQLSRSTAQRILREQNPLPPPAPPKADEPPAPNTAEPHHILRPTRINRTCHMDLTTLDFLFIRFYVAAIVDGFSRKLLALKVYKDAPSARNMLALVTDCVKNFGTPRFLVTDGGTQFKAKFKRGLKPLGIVLVKGRDAKRFNGRVERFLKRFGCGSAYHSSPGRRTGFSRSWISSVSGTTSSAPCSSTAGARRRKSGPALNCPNQRSSWRKMRPSPCSLSAAFISKATAICRSIQSRSSVPSNGSRSNPNLSSGSLKTHLPTAVLAQGCSVSLPSDAPSCTRAIFESQRVLVPVPASPSPGPLHFGSD